MKNVDYIVSAYKDSDKKLAVVVQKQMCVLKFGSASQKEYWAEILLSYCHKLKGGTNYASEDSERIRTNLIEAELQKNKSEINIPVFYKTASIKDRELTYRIQAFSELLDLSVDYLIERTHAAFLEIQRYLQQSKISISEQCHYFWYSLKSGSQRQAGIYLNVPQSY